MACLLFNGCSKQRVYFYYIYISNVQMQEAYLCIYYRYISDVQLQEACLCFYYRYISDVQMQEACLCFVREHSEIVSFKLRNNFLCHLATLYDAGVLQTKHVKTIVDALPKKCSTAGKGKATVNGHCYLQPRVKSEPNK